MENNPCYLCQAPVSSFICFCQRKFLCKSCVSFHLLNDPTIRHNPVPLASHELIEQILTESEEGLREDRSAGSFSGRDEKTRIREVLERELARLQQFQVSAIEQLQQVRTQWVEEINRATREIEQILVTKCETMTKEIMQCLADLEESVPSPCTGHSLSLLSKSSDSSMLDMSIDLRPIDLNVLIKQFVSISLGYSQPQSSEECSLYKFFGGQGNVSVFDPMTEKMVNNYHSQEPFLHNSSWVVAPTGEIYITGGSLMGKSKDDALQFSPKDERTQVLPSMLTPRRSHTTIFLNNKLYVFGGIHEERKLAQCEALSPDAQEWLGIMDMTHPRAYLGSTVYKEKVYLAGGADFSGMEVFHPEANSFDYLSLEQAGLTEACALLTLEDTIVILHGNYQGEVFSYKPESNEYQRVCEMCHGNSWSNCPPVRYKDAIYTIRSDSVFKFEMNTNKSSYVLRMAKTAKKRKSPGDLS